MDIRSCTTRSMRSRPDTQLVLDQLTDGLDPAVAQVIDVVRELPPLFIDDVSSMTRIRSIGQRSLVDGLIRPQCAG